MKKTGRFIFLFMLSYCARAQTTFPTNGAPNIAHTTYAFINATIFTDYQTSLQNSILLVKDGKVLAVGNKVQVPKDAVVQDLKGKFIYPSFIDIYSEYGISANKFEKKSSPGPQMESSLKGAFAWNQAIRSNVEAYKQFVHNTERSAELKKAGFGTVLAFQRDGIVRGSGVLVNLDDKRENESILIDRAAAFYSFSKGSSTQDYPNSLTGAIALLRQTYYDAAWYAQNKKKSEYNISLDEFNKLQVLPSIFETSDKFSVTRAAKVGAEFGVKYLIKGSGNEYQRINDMQATGCSFIIPLNFPEPYDVEDPYDAESISLTDLKHWELAPANPAFLEKYGLSFCITAADLKDKASFLKNLRKAVSYGLSETMALKALTANPASFINAGDKIGALKSGFYANFFICSKSLFDEESVIMQHWVNGGLSSFSDPNAADIRGNYELLLSAKKYTVTLSGDAAKPSGRVSVDTGKTVFNFNFLENLLTFNFMYDTLNTLRATGVYQAEAKRFVGRAQLASGDWTDFRMTLVSSADTAKKTKPENKKQELKLGKIIYPFTAYGEPLEESKGIFKDNWNKFKNRYGAILIKDATVWTNSGDTVLKEYDVYVANGKVVRIAPNIDAPNTAYATVIDAKGKHLTPGIIDEHSHIALTAGVNEGTQASSAEVRMGDVINPEDINIYRQLSGGVTTAQLLHGSANPIGGQSALIKLRWGHSAEDMKYENADGFIKFALGENVKQSNWGVHNTVRFPQSRMGVEQVYVDFFSRAKDYDGQKRNAAKSAIPLRKDLELEALSEVLTKKRFITCHSYVQSEINMLMHVADSFGFKVNTFTHILEGYKVADKMKAHGVCASTFSDWWAYKNEVMEAIPYNAAILTKMGVTTAINSDDAEMARRLNQEAAKSVKYGGLTETQALKLVTLNPAKMLHIDDKVGSISAGKVADLVLWTDNPLSVYAKVDKTIIDGQIYFDRDEDAKLRESNKAERARIVSKLLAEKQKGTKTVKAPTKKQRLYHCNTIEGVEENLTGTR